MPAKSRGRPFQKGEGGRPKGSLNKLTTSIKEGVTQQFIMMQHDAGNKAYKWRLEEFAAKYPRDFYSIAARLIPTEIHARLTKVELNIVRTNPNTSTNPAQLPASSNGNGEAV